jgi:Protein of unknown function (DUF3160)
MRNTVYSALALLLCLPMLLPACEASPTTVPVSPGVVPLEGVHLDGDASRPYLAKVSFSPQEAQYFDLVDRAMSLSEAEIERLAQNGFVVSGRLAWERFLEAYAWIYWQDLPVLVTTDSVLHAVHQSYDDLLMNLELSILAPRLEQLLRMTREQAVADRRASADDKLDALYGDVATYLDVAWALLKGEEGGSRATERYVAQVVAADSVAEVDLFGSGRTIDFTLFKPRGHYTKFEELQRYFRAMAWLAEIDFRFVEFDPATSAPILHLEQIAAAAILRDALAVSGGRETWAQINSLVEVLVGPSDNVTLPDLDRFLADAALTNPASILQADDDAILALLTGNDYGQQRITGQLIYRHTGSTSEEPIPRPVSFMLLGQRFAVDSYVMSNLVYDRLMVDGRPVERALPSPLDVMAALGNDRAVTHLADELKTYGYEGHLAALRAEVEGLPASFWDAPVYDQWLRMIRALNPATTAMSYPQAMRTEAWADKMLQTQLGSWAQLRHDNVLYVKQSVTAMAVCEYPAGYVEPYPDFFGALYELAKANGGALAQLDVGGLEPYAGEVRDKAVAYFDKIMPIAERLKGMAEKELRLEPFSTAETQFLKEVVIRRIAEGGCAGPVVEWTGWYRDLFYGSDGDPALIADVHTNPNDDPSSGLYPPRVLHVATGPAVPIFLIVDTDEGPTLYVGPAFTYFEVVEEGTPPVRLTDEEWQARLSDDPTPSAPAWTASFRLSPAQQPMWLQLPEVGE